MLVTVDRDLHERAFIAHDPSCIHDGLSFGRPVFGGLGGYRMSEISAAILRSQLERLDGILERLRARRDLLAEALSEVPRLIRSPEHDPAGSCGTHLGYLLENSDAVAAFRAALSDRPAFVMATNTLGHSFFEWELLHAGRGAHHPGRNPLVDRVLQQADSLPVSQDILCRSVVVGFGLDLDEAAVSDIHQALAKEFG